MTRYFTFFGIAMAMSVTPAFAQTKAKAENVELTELSAYSTKYTGYPITKGTLMVDVHYILAEQFDVDGCPQADLVGSLLLLVIRLETDVDLLDLGRQLFFSLRERHRRDAPGR